jgi:glutathione S-transferase
MSWLTVVRMMQVKGGFRAPGTCARRRSIRTQANNLRPTIASIIRRIQLNDLSLPYFFVAGFLFVLTEPSLLVARLLLYGYVVSRFLHFAAYLSARDHNRASFGRWVFHPHFHDRLDPSRRTRLLIGAKGTEPIKIGY